MYSGEAEAQRRSVELLKDAAGLRATAPSRPFRTSPGGSAGAAG